MFDPATKLFYDLWEVAGIPTEWAWRYNRVSPDGKYVWIEGFDGGYLVDLITFESLYYPEANPYTYPDIDWSADSKFVWAANDDSDNKYTEVNILSISDKRLHPVPVTLPFESVHLWHPVDNVVVHPANDKNALIFLDAETMSFRELPFKDQDTQYKISNLAWNPNGDKLIFITENHILWQVDYPTLDNLEQLVASADTIGGAQWAPDGDSIAFISGSDIYIVDTIK